MVTRQTPIEQAFELTFRAIFGECDVSLDELKDYLLRYHPQVTKSGSNLSGKDVLLSSDKYRVDGKFISHDEIDWKKQFSPLDINEIKDIDSIIGAITDRICYTGNKVFGNSHYVAETDNCFDSSYVYNAHNIHDSKYIAHSAFIRENSQYVFGSTYLLRSAFLIKAMWADKLTRCFETYASGFSSDLFFCYNCNDCAQAMFSFNLRSKRYAIGNLEVPKGKYFGLKKKLLKESAELIKRDKSFYSPFDITGHFDKNAFADLKHKRSPQENVPAVLKKVDSGFSSTCKVIFDRQLGPLAECEGLFGKVGEVKATKTVLGNDIHYTDEFIFKHIPRERMVNSDEAEELGKLAISVEGNEDLADVFEKIKKIAFFRMDFYEGNCENFAESPLVYYSSDVYRVMDATSAKNCAYGTMVLRSEYCYGCFRILNSKFCINSYFSTNLARSFEMDASNACSGAYFLHNCENVHDSMFCFNSKNLRNAIGNAPLSPSGFNKVKLSLLEQLCSEFERKKSLKWSIYRIGSARG